jgi:hypothetical protein
MICTNSLYEASHELFTGYPLATRTVNRSGTVRSMVLMLQDGEDRGFFVLSQDRGDAKPSYSLWPWPAGDIVDIEVESSIDVPDVAVNAVTRGVPIPRDGSLFGWTGGDAISALIVVYAEYTPAYPEPGWAVMPLAGTPEAQWPPFTGEPLFGHWSWEQFQAGSIISLEGLIAETPDTVCWVDTKAVLGSDCCAVARDISTRAGHVLRHGCYVYFQALRAGKPVPSLKALLADPGKIDLAPRFQRYQDSGG